MMDIDNQNKIPFTFSQNLSIKGVRVCVALRLNKLALRRKSKNLLA